MERNKKRAPDKTTLGISMTKTLKCKISKAAEADHRNMAQWCVVQLEKILGHKEEKNKPEGE